jgi:hypothetical protein
VLFGDFSQERAGLWHGAFSRGVVAVSYRIFVIDALDEFYGGVGFFEGQDPRGQAYRNPPYIDNLNILSIY